MTPAVSDREHDPVDVLLLHGTLAPGTGRGWVLALAQGWSLPEDLAPAPMVGHHGGYAVLLVRKGGPVVLDAPAARP